MLILRWLWRGSLSIAALAVLVWAPIFDWMSPPSVARNRSARDAVRGRPTGARLVVLISVDGLAPWVLHSTETPGLDRIAAQGRAAAEALTVHPSITLTSHTSMLSGVSPEVHGVRFNRYQPWSRIDQPTVFSVCHSAGLRCALFAGKRKFAHFAEFEAGVDHYAWAADAATVLARALDYARSESPDFLMIHLAEVDLAGHDAGWGSESQREALRAIDRLLDDFLLQLVAGGDRPVTAIVTADHGGHGKNHHEGTAADVAIPWIAWGDGIDTEAELVRVEIADTAPTVLSLLGVPIPPHWTGRPRF